MESYFFIPGNKKKFLEKIHKIKADHLIIDLEDSVNHNDVNFALTNILALDNFQDFYIRIPFDSNATVFDADGSIARLAQAGACKFVIPKVETGNQLQQVVHFILSQSHAQTTLQLILLIESPLALMNLIDMISHSCVVAVGLGSHDFSATLAAKHDAQVVNWARMQVLLIAKAYQKQAIDVASMNIKHQDLFATECLAAFDNGYDGKFLIHPSQLETMKKLKYFSEEELEKALKIKEYVQNRGGIENFHIFTLNGEVIEKPHLNRYRRILKSGGYGSF